MPKKLLTIATGGLSALPGAIAHKDLKSIATGGMFTRGGQPQTPGAAPADQLVEHLNGAFGDRVRQGMGFRGRRMGPMPVPGAKEYLGSFAPQEQQRIQGTWAGNPNGINDWFHNAQAAGAVPKAPVVAPIAEAPAQAAPNPIASQVQAARRQFEMSRGAMGRGPRYQ